MALLLGNDTQNSLADRDPTSVEIQKRISNASVGPEDGSEVFLLDPSEHFRPEHKSPEEYRIYTTNQVGLIIWVYMIRCTDASFFHLRMTTFRSASLRRTRQCTPSSACPLPRISCRAGLVSTK